MDEGARPVVEVGGRAILAADLAVEPYEPLRGELEAFLARCRGELTGAGALFVDGAEGRRALATALAVMDAIEG